MLWRALSHVEQGFYIDIGAQDPLVDSVSLAFYERGWRGIHVEPTPFYAEALRQARQRDIVIQAAIGRGPEVLPFFEIPETGISTADPTIAEQHRQRGFHVKEITVSCLPLSAVLKMRLEQDVHWLKIDVEGFELQVLDTWDTCPVRPWIVVVESTLPLTQIETHASWETLILSYGYAAVYFDGLNRYYVSDAHPELKEAFRSPPNVFDGFRLNGTASATFHKLIEERFNNRMSETRVQFEQQEQSTNIEIERLKLELASQGMEIGERERTLSQQLLANQQELRSLEQDGAQREREYIKLMSDAQQQLGASLLALAQREQEIGAKLLDIQQRAHQESVDKDRIHSERVHTLNQEHIERERTLSLQLLAAQQELRGLEQDRVQRERDHVKLMRDAQQQLEASLLRLAQREQEIAAHLLDIQQRTDQASAEKDRIHSERVDALHQEHTEREHYFAQQLQAAQQDLRRLEQVRVQRERENAQLMSDCQQRLEASLRTLAQRERELGAQILSIQRSAELEIAEKARRHCDEVRALASQHREDEQALRHEHSKRERTLTDQVAALELEVRTQFAAHAKRETALQDEIVEVKREAENLVSSKERLILNYQSESSDAKNQYQRLLESTSELEVALKDQLAAERRENQELQRMLGQLHDEISEIHSSLPWRITAPFRKFYFRHTAKTQPGLTLRSEKTSGSTSSSNQKSLPVVISPLIDRSDMPSFIASPGRCTTASPATVKELLARCDSDFVHHAYLVVLNRNPDPEGLSYYLERVRAGVSKIEVLSQLRRSKEGRNATPLLADVDQVVASYRKQRIPVAGFLYRTLTGSSRLSIIERQLSALENRLALIDERSNERFSRLEEGLSSLQSQAAQHTQSLLNAIADIPNGTVLKDHSRTPEFPLPKGVDGLSADSKRIYSSLKAAIITHSLQHKEH